MSSSSLLSLPLLSPNLPSFLSSLPFPSFSFLFLPFNSFNFLYLLFFYLSFLSFSSLFLSFPFFPLFCLLFTFFFIPFTFFLFLSLPYRVPDPDRKRFGLSGSWSGSVMICTDPAPEYCFLTYHLTISITTKGYKWWILLFSFDEENFFSATYP